MSVATELRKAAALDGVFCLTGGQFGQPHGRLRPEFSAGQCGALDAPSYVPTGGCRMMVIEKISFTRVVVCSLRDGVLS